MNTRYSCALDGVSPERLDACILVTDITEMAPRCQVVTSATLRHGLRHLRRVRQSLTVRISFLLREYDPVQRRAAMQKLFAWAEGGGVLTTSDRPGQQLRVECDTLPAMSALCWLDEMSLSFTAYETPFWESAEMTESADGLLLLPGTADEAPVDAQIVHQGSGTLTEMTLRCGDTAISLQGLALSPGAEISIRADNGVLHILNSGESLLMHRTPESHDLLLAPCGVATTVSAEGDQPLSASFRARGRYL